MYKVVYKFKDLQDGNHIYEVGDTYPRDGYEPSSSRIAELASSNNKIGKTLIEGDMPEPEPVVEKEVVVEEEPDVEEEPVVRRRRNK